MQTRAALYIRLSRSTDASTSIVRQGEDLQALARREGWEVDPAHIFEDNNKSGGREREKAQRALALLASGAVDVLAVYAVDRWSRLGIRSAADVIDAVNAHGGRFIAAREGIDSHADPANWELRLSLALDVAKKERDATIARVQSSQRYLKSAGYWEGGRVPFGYAAVPHPDNPSKRTLIVRDREAAIIRELATRLAAGELPSRLAHELTDRGIPTPTSGARRAETLALAGRPLPQDLDVSHLGHWSTQSVQSIMTGDTLLGRRHEWTLLKHTDPETGKTYQKKTGLRVQRDPDTGAPRQWWPAILTVAELEAVRARVNNPEDRGKYRIRPDRIAQRQRASRLLSGLAFCTCGGKLYPITQHSPADNYRPRTLYRCNATKCRQKASVTATTLESYVTAHHLSEFGALPVLQATTDSAATAEHDAALADVMAQIRDASALLAESATPERFSELQDLQAQRDALQASTPPTVTTYTPTGQTHAEAWADAEARGDIDYMRDLLRWHYERVTVRKGRLPVEERTVLDERHMLETLDVSEVE